MSLNTQKKLEGQDLEAEGRTVHVLCTASNQDQAASQLLLEIIQRIK